MLTILRKASLLTALTVACLAGPGMNTAKADGWGGPGYGYDHGSGYGRGGGGGLGVGYGASGGAFTFGYNAPGFSVGFAKGYATPGFGYGRPVGLPGLNSFYDTGFRGGPGGHCPPRRPLPPPCPCPPIGYGGARFDTWSTSYAPYGPSYPW